MINVVNKNTTEPIPTHFATLEEAGEFWDNHDLGDYWEFTEEVEFDVALQEEKVLVAVDPGLAKKVASMAHQRGLATETLINLWLSEKIHEISSQFAVKSACMTVALYLGQPKLLLGICDSIFTECNQGLRRNRYAGNS